MFNVLSVFCQKIGLVLNRVTENSQGNMNEKKIEYSDLSNEYKNFKRKLQDCSEDVDDGYSRSDGAASYYSANETLTSSNSSDSSTSGLASATSSNFSSTNALGRSSEIVHKILVSSEVNDAIFKPDYRILFSKNGEPRYWRSNNIDDIDFLKEHTTENCDLLESENDTISSEFLALFSKIFVRVSLEKNVSPYDGPVVKIHVRKDRSNRSLVLLDLIWINLYDNKIVPMDNFSEPITLTKFESVDLCIPVNKFELSKDYKLVVYYRSFYMMFSKEFLVKVTTRPISTMYMEKMEHYFPEPKVRQLDRCNYKLPPNTDGVTEEVKMLKEQILTYEKSESASRLSSANYYSMYKLLLQMEDETDSKRSLRHDQFKQRVQHEFGKRYSLQINNKRLEAAINEYTRVWIAPMSLRMAEAKLNEIQFQRQKRARQSGQPMEPIRKSKKQRIYGSVVEVKGNKVFFELNESLNHFFSKTRVQPAVEEYFIRFMSDRTTITLEHRALEYLNNQDIAHFFFPDLSMACNWPSNETHPSMYTNKPIEWCSNDTNEQQKSAVINILKQTSYPYPYLLFGPPGTGKTKTLIEAILQIIRNDNPDEFILVCATSNSACNEVAQRLLTNCGSDKVFRIFAKSATFKLSELPNDLVAASNLKKGEHYYPSLQVIYQYKVIVCTLTTAGRLSQGKINPKHFSHIFIDEAGSATETQTIIAVAGLCSTKNQIHANLIFAGDPKQLGPLIKSQQAVKMGYGVSMLERLITTNSMYMRNETTKKFNENYVTQLICNYRSHPSILHSSNNLYYDNALQVCAPEENTDWFLNTSILNDPIFPVIFHSVKGNTVRDRSNPSSYNKLEIETTLDYIQRIFKMSDRKITQNDIGIISPYRRQCDELLEQCSQKGYKDIQIGSVEIFQGKEKPIIIVSTVRSQMNNIGFLDSKKRLNVLLTRAKCLLIIIGDADTLAKDEDWCYVIQFCKANNSLIE